jgi:hypothetical protein
MVQNSTNILSAHDQLLSFLISKGFTKDVALKQIKELSEIIWLSALNRIFEEKGIDLAEVNSLSGKEKLAFIEKNITADELAGAMEIESNEKITAYLAAISA